MPKLASPQIAMATAVRVSLFHCARLSHRHPRKNARVFASRTSCSPKPTPDQTKQTPPPLSARYLCQKPKPRGEVYSITTLAVAAKRNRGVREWLGISKLLVMLSLLDATLAATMAQ